jgi:hypothetical protein
MNIGINDEIPFGRFKGYLFSDVMQTRPDYCAWLRDTKLKARERNPFSKEANLVIDEAIRQSKSLRNKYAVLYPTDEDHQLKAILKEAHDAKVAHDAAAFEERKNTVYADQWGAW